MMYRKESLGWFALTMIVALFLASPGTATELQGSQRAVARLESGPTRIDWLPQADYEQWVLTVAGPGDLYIRREFKGGKTPFLSLFDSEGSRLPDGSYVWELRGIPKANSNQRALVQSGNISIKDGSFLVKPGNTIGGDPKPPLRGILAKDLIENGDLIVKGNACIGSDCTNLDANVDVLKLKATHPSILFDEIGVLSLLGGASLDWGLLINPSDVDQFAIANNDGTVTVTPFTLTGGAPDNSLFVAGNGNVGLGTATPAVRLDIKSSVTGAAAGRVQNSSATGYSGFEYLDNDGHEDLFFGIDNANSTTRLNSIHNNPIAILTNDTERMRITTGGSVGIGATTPGARLDVKTTAANEEVVRITNLSATGYPGINYFDEAGMNGLYFGLDNPNSTTRMNSVNNNPIVLMTNDVEHLRIESDGDVGINCNNPTSDLVVASGSGCSTPSSSLNAGSSQFTVSSSRTLKENLSPIQVPNILDKIARTNVFAYDFIDGPKDRMGLMAEDFHEVFGRGSDKVIDGQEVEMALWLAVQELTAQNRQLSKQLGVCAPERI
jgi:hypothetical protein